MHTPGKTYGKERNLPQAPERQSMKEMERQQAEMEKERQRMMRRKQRGER